MKILCNFTKSFKQPIISPESKIAPVKYIGGNQNVQVFVNQNLYIMQYILNYTMYTISTTSKPVNILNFVSPIFYVISRRAFITKTPFYLNTSIYWRANISFKICCQTKRFQLQYPLWTIKFLRHTYRSDMTENYLAPACVLMWPN